MIHILHNQYTIDEDWCFEAFSKHLQPNMSVAVLPFSFQDARISTSEDWQAYYGAEKGIYYRGIVNAFQRYGIAEAQIVWVNYFDHDDMQSKGFIASSDILYFTGGLPDRMMERLIEKNLVEAIQNHPGVVMGYSAGALIQLSEYHLTPDKDYPEFGYYKGLSLLDTFYIEVHFENTELQRGSIERILYDRQKPVYAIGDKGAVIINQRDIQFIGDVEAFENIRRINSSL